MSRHISNAGAFYTYITESLGNRQCIAAVLLALVSYNMMQIGLYGLFGFSLINLILAYSNIAIPRWICALLNWCLVGLMGLRSIDFSVKILSILVALEFIVVLTVSIISLVTAPEGISAVTFSPEEFFIPGIGVLFAFGVAAFMGFESGASIQKRQRKEEKPLPMPPTLR